MTVKELIDFLQTHPPGMLVGYRIFSEQCLLEADDIQVVGCCDPRPDGWIQDARPDKPTRQYLIFPGN